MAQNFLSGDREQPFLFPASVREWLPGEHLVWFVIDAVGVMDLSAFYGVYREDGHGRAAYEPSMVVALLLYCWARGVRSSRRIERACVEDVACRVIVAHQGRITRRSRGLLSVTRRRLASCSVRCCGFAPPWGWLRLGLSRSMARRSARMRTGTARWTTSRSPGRSLRKRSRQTRLRTSGLVVVAVMSCRTRFRLARAGGSGWLRRAGALTRSARSSCAGPALAREAAR
jgi:hypothetical protein